MITRNKVLHVMSKGIKLLPTPDIDSTIQLTLKQIKIQIHAVTTNQHHFYLLHQ